MEQNIDYLKKRIADLKAEKERSQQEHQLKHELWGLEHPTLSRLQQGLRGMGQKVGSSLSQGMGQLHERLHEKKKGRVKKSSGGFGLRLPNPNQSMLGGRNPRFGI
jgi:hypothetical protein